MLGELRCRLTYANVMATAAMFVALGGSSVAAVQLAKNSVGTRQIKNGQVRRVDLANDAVNAAKVADGSLLARDFKAGQLPTGPAGPQGPQGPKGDSGVAALRVRAAVGSGEVTASCLPGERASGGGAHSADGYIIASAPVADPLAIFSNDPIQSQGYTSTSWTAAADDGNGAPAHVTAWVVCASP